MDESKLVISVRGCVRRGPDGGIIPADGVWLQDQLRERYHLEMEMAGADYVVAILTYLDTQQGLDRLTAALLELDRMVEGAGEKEAVFDIAFPEAAMTLAEASESRWEEQRLEDCAGKISAEFIYVYPPGIPIVAPGEILTPGVIRQIQQYKDRNLPVQGMADEDADVLRIVTGAAGKQR